MHLALYLHFSVSAQRHALTHISSECSKPNQHEQASKHPFLGQASSGLF